MNSSPVCISLLQDTSWLAATMLYCICEEKNNSLAKVIDSNNLLNS